LNKVILKVNFSIRKSHNFYKLAQAN